MFFGWLLHKKRTPDGPSEEDRGLNRALRAERDELARELAAARNRNRDAGERIAELEAALEDTPASAASASAPPPAQNATAAPDDLTQIFGIGPYIQSKLAELGITSFREVADMDDERIEYVGRHIGYFPDRIRREDWPGVAARLHRAKYGEDVTEAEEAGS